jgi:2-polyprenyl-6-methoxyphenol hydroxylase-like FAD-dependent oxidoreductase
VTPTRPLYAGQLFLTGFVRPENPYYKTVEANAGLGPMVVMGRNTAIWNQRQGDGHYRVDLGFLASEEFGNDGTVDLEDLNAVKQLMLDDHFFGKHAQDFKDLIEALEGPFRTWPMWYINPDALNWKSVPGVTIIGDAAHTTPPFAGDGVNCALRDSIILCEQLRKYGITQEAIEEYEKQMFPLGADLIERSVRGGKLFYHWNSPEAFIKGIMEKPLFGHTDDF